MKTCIKCGQKKPLEMFYAHPTMADGHLTACKECLKTEANARYHRKILTPEWKLEQRRRNRLRMRLSRAIGSVPSIPKEQKREITKLWRLNHPDKWSAHQGVHNAVKSGGLIRQNCERCGHVSAQAHHDDYSKPLEVRWFCAACHAAHHVALREAELLKQAG